MNHTVNEIKRSEKFEVSRAFLDWLYFKYNKRELIHPDPLELVHNYDNPADREVAGLIASSLAYGRVAQILKSVSYVLERLPTPSVFLRDVSTEELHSIFSTFKHRFSTSSELVDFLTGIKRILMKYGTLEGCFKSGYSNSDETYYPALQRFSCALAGNETRYNSLLPMHNRNSCFKRMNLYLRWMIRKDEIDPGCWIGLTPSKLLIPLDTHIFRISHIFGFTERKSPDFKAVLEITERFRRLCPEDPVRYDFVLAGLGIRSQTDLMRLYNEFKQNMI